MGRNSKIVPNEEEKPQDTNATLEKVVQPERVEHQPEAMQKVNLRPKQAKSGKAYSQKKGAKYQTAFRRRSERIQNMAMPVRNEDIETVVIEDVNLNESEPAVIEERTLNENDNDEQDANMEVNEERTLNENNKEDEQDANMEVNEERTLNENDKEDEQDANMEVNEERTLNETDKEDEQHANMEEEQPEETSRKKNMEEKIDHLVQLLESQGNAVETLNRLHKKRSFSSANSNMTYKSLYVDSQKKIEALTKENCQLSLKLEVALAKLEAQEKGTLVFSELAEKIKDTVLMASLTRATETAITMTSDAIRSAIFSQDVVGGPGNTAKRNRGSERK